MTDRELLELAAKAAGIKGEFVRNKAYVHQGMPTGFEWNPLTDDGDAFRLAVKLRLDIYNYGPGAPGPREELTYVDAINYKGSLYGMASEDIRDEAGALTATRLAIVRAAAEIGKAMP